MNPTPHGTRRICLHWRSDPIDDDDDDGDGSESKKSGDRDDEDFWYRCCWLATKPYSEYQMIETQVMVTPKKKAVDVGRMHLDYKYV